MSKKLLTAEDLKEIAISDLSYEKICAIYKIGKNTVAKIKKAAGTCSGSRNANSKRLNDQERQYVIDSKLDGATLSKELGISISSVSAIRRKACVAVGRGINIRLSLTPEQKKEIAFCTLSRVETVKKYGISAFMYHKIKKEFGTALGRGNGIRTTGFKLTDSQKSEIAKSDLSAKELSEKYGIHVSQVNKIKKKAGLQRSRSHQGNKIELSDSLMERIKDITISARELNKETGLSLFVIHSRRAELGIKHTREKPKRTYVSHSQDNPKCYLLKKPKTEKKPQAKKQLPVKIMKPKKEVAPIKESQYTYDQKQLEKAKLTAANHKQNEADKLKNGWRWITVPGRFSIKETKLVSPEDYIKLKQAI